VDFEIEHSLDAPPQRVADVLLDRHYQAHLGDHLGVLSHRAVLGQEDLDYGRVRRRIRCVLELHLGGPARRFLGHADPAYVETAVWHPDDLRGDWTIEPEIAKDLLHAEGSIRLLPNGGGTARVVAGIVRVRVPIYGGKVEGWIVSGLREAYDEEAVRLATWLRNPSSGRKRTK
jgi:hypothetical protein